jgi:NADPH:quinone reductase-like Zn-dependent oxidoreductase
VEHRETGLVRSPGAAHAIDYFKESLADARHRYDLIIDIAGNPCPARLRRAGRIVSSVATREQSARIGMPEWLPADAGAPTATSAQRRARNCAPGPPDLKAVI